MRCFYNFFPHWPTESEAGPALVCPSFLPQYASAPHKVGLQVDSGPHFPHTSTDRYTYSHAHTHTHTNPSVPAYPLGSYALPRLDTVQGLHLSAPLRPPSQLMAGQPSETSKTDETRPPDTSILGSQAGPKLLLTAWKFLRFLPYLSSVSNS